MAETRLHPANLVLPLFVVEGLDAPRPIASMPGVMQHNPDSPADAAREASAAGIGGLMLFGIPLHKDAIGSEGTNPEGILAKGVRVLAEAAPTRRSSPICAWTSSPITAIAVLDEAGRVDNDATLTHYATMARVLADAGATMVGTSGAMDGCGCRAGCAGRVRHVNTAIPPTAPSTRPPSTHFPGGC